MKVKNVLKILEVVENLPADMYDILHYHEDAKDVGVRSIALIGEGENTLHPDFHEILERRVDAPYTSQ